jgi:hypothetical protein
MLGDDKGVVGVVRYPSEELREHLAAEELLVVGSPFRDAGVPTAFRVGVVVIDFADRQDADAGDLSLPGPGPRRDFFGAQGLTAVVLPEPVPPAGGAQRMACAPAL